MPEASTPQLALLIGPPNVGKTSLFNWLTGHSSRIVNYPGATVGVQRAPLLSTLSDLNVLLLDTPGLVSFQPQSEDEQLTLNLLQAEAHAPIILVLDSTQLYRHLNLAFALKRLGRDFVIALSMVDEISESVSAHELALSLMAPVVLIDSKLGGGLDELLQALKGICRDAKKSFGSKSTSISEPLFSSQDQMDGHNLAKRLQLIFPKTRSSQLTSRLDQILLISPWTSLFSFFLLQALMFGSVFWLADPMMTWIEDGASNLSHFLAELLPIGFATRFLLEAFLPALSAFLVFVPQIAILFIVLELFEQSGYLARASALIDSPLQKIGLSGRSFSPLLSGFACAIPALLATRQIPSKRERFLTQLIIPLMTCSARLPVYALLITLLLRQSSSTSSPLLGGLLMALMYSLGLIGGAIVSGIVGRFLKTETQISTSYFLLELPAYRLPQATSILKSVVSRTRSFIVGAGPTIAAVSVVLWLMMEFPTGELQTSYLAQIGQALNPLFAPMGLDWRVGVAILAAFAAREVFVAALAVVVGFGELEFDHLVTNISQLTLDQSSSSSAAPLLLFSIPSLLGLLFFFLIALQCSSTVAMIKAESKSWKFALAQLVIYNLVAYAGAVAIFQLASL